MVNGNQELKLDYAQDPLNYYHKAINHQIPEKAEVYIP